MPNEKSTWRTSSSSRFISSSSSDMTIRSVSWPCSTSTPSNGTSTPSRRAVADALPPAPGLDARQRERIASLVGAVRGGHGVNLDKAQLAALLPLGRGRAASGRHGQAAGARLT